MLRLALCTLMAASVSTGFPVFNNVADKHLYEANLRGFEEAAAPDAIFTPGPFANKFAAEHLQECLTNWATSVTTLGDANSPLQVALDVATAVGEKLEEDKEIYKVRRCDEDDDNEYDYICVQGDYATLSGSCSFRVEFIPQFNNNGQMLMIDSRASNRGDDGFVFNGFQNKLNTLLGVPAGGDLLPTVPVGVPVGLEEEDVLTNVLAPVLDMLASTSGSQLNQQAISALVTALLTVSPEALDRHMDKDVLTKLHTGAYLASFKTASPTVEVLKLLGADRLAKNADSFKKLFNDATKLARTDCAIVRNLALLKSTARKFLEQEEGRTVVMEKRSKNTVFLLSERSTKPVDAVLKKISTLAKYTSKEDFFAVVGQAGLSSSQIEKIWVKAVANGAIRVPDQLKANSLQDMKVLNDAIDLITGMPQQ